MRIPLLALALAGPLLAQEHTHGADKDAKVPTHEKHAMDPAAPKPITADGVRCVN